MNFKYLISLLLLISASSTSAMQQPRAGSIPFEIRNNSPEVVTVIYHDARANPVRPPLVLAMVYANETTSQNWSGVPFALNIGSSIRLATTKGHFSFGLDSVDTLTFSKANPNRGWTDTNRYSG